MFDINMVSKRYFEAKFEAKDDNGKIYSAHLEIEPPKLKAIEKLTAIIKDMNKKAEAEATDDLHNAMRIILNKNKTGYKVPDQLIENLDTDQMEMFLGAFFGWLNKNKKDPN
jgi:hypothetical protein